MNPDPSLAAEEAEIKAQIDAINKKEKKQPKHCGDFLDEPPYEREINCFCGLKNQGATCYLNSLIQLLYMAPELRNTILSLPLCKDSLDEPTDFVTATTSKYKILMALQKLFSEMQDLNIKSLTTEKVTESFGWQQNQAMVQQDIQEASRVMLDVLERALTGTNFADSIPRLYKGTLVNHLQCLNCQLIKEREESFYDLILQVKNCTSIEESLLNMLNMEKLEGSNQYFCENCNKKVDADKGIKIRKFPPILTLSLSRFEYDFTKDELKKLNDSVKFGLELDISMFSERPELYENENDRIYELAGVLIHRGSPYSGHYHAYIRDLLKEGDWKGKMHALKEKARLEKEKENKGAETPAGGEGEKKEGEEKGLEDQSTDEEEKDTNEEKAINDIERSLGQNPSQSNYLSQNFKVIQKKRGKNAKKNSKKNKKKKNTGYTNKPTTSNKKDKKKDDDDDEDEFDDTILDDVAFPVEYSNTELQYDWFDFNDATVSPIPVNRLQIQFGGSFSENAYILVYRQKSLANNPEFKKINVQQYMMKSIETQNEAMEAVRAVYREAEAHLEVVTLYPELLDMHERKFPQSINLVENGNKLRVKFEDTVDTIFTQVKDQNPKEIALVEVQVLPNNLVQFKRLLDENSFDQKIRDLKIECWSTWLIYRKDDPVFIKEVLPYCGEAFVPMRVNLRSPQFMDATVITHENTILLEFRKHIEEACGVPLEYQQLLLMEGEAPKMLNTKEEENLEEITKLGITDNSDVLVNARDPEELKQETSSKGKNKLGTDELLSVMVERDDDKTSVKYYIDLEWTLDDLIKNIKKKLNLPLDSERRLKKSKGNVLFYEEDLSKKLREFNIGEGTKFCLEKGKIPQLGSLVLRVRNQSKYKKESDPVELDITVSPNEQLLDLKRRLCMDLGLVAKNHRLFQVDWLDEPVQMFSNEEKTVREAPLKPGELIVLRDKDNSVPRDVIKLNLYFTKTGFHADSEYVGIIQGREDQTLMELKSMIMIMPKFSEGHPDIAITQVRIREMRHFGFFGTVFNDDAATLKTLKFESNMSIVVQILDKPEQLSDYAIVLLMKKRLVEYRTYTTYEEFVWDCSKAPTVEEFKKAVIEFKGLNIGLDEIELAKYNPDEFEWQHISKEFCDAERMKKKKKAQTKNKNKRARPVVIDNPDEPENLKEAPYWLRDGDIVAYRLEADNPKKDDDFQSIEDEENRRRFKEGGNDEKSNTQKNNNVGGFQIYTDF